MVSNKFLENFKFKTRNVLKGSYLRIAKAFIESPEKLSDKYGNIEKILAAEWAKFRWGVFDDRKSRYM